MSFALAVILGCGTRMFTPPRVRMVIASFIVAGSILSYAGYHFTVSPHREDWRAAANFVRGAVISPNTPVLVRSALIEAANANFDLAMNRDSPLLCPLSKYPMPGRVILLPSRLNWQAIRYLEQISAEVLAGSDSFVVVSRRGDDEFIPWLQGWLLAQGFQPSGAGHAEGVPVFLVSSRSAGSACSTMNLRHL